MLKILNTYLAGYCRFELNMTELHHSIGDIPENISTKNAILNIYLHYCITLNTFILFLVENIFCENRESQMLSVQLRLFHPEYSINKI